MKRRQLLQAAACASLSAIWMSQAAQAAVRQPTPRQAEGPFYPVEPIPLNNNLRLHSDHEGAPLWLHGRLVDMNGNALSGLRVEIWQCDARSIYHHPAAGQNEPDPAFRGFGATMTNDFGQYSFATIVPVPYPGRPPHIHAKVRDGEQELLTTQIYLQQQSPSADLAIAPFVNERDEYEARFDFVLDSLALAT